MAELKSNFGASMVGHLLIRDPDSGDVILDKPIKAIKPKAKDTGKPNPNK